MSEKNLHERSELMRVVLNIIDEEYGSIDEFLDAHDYPENEPLSITMGRRDLVTSAHYLRASSATKSTLFTSVEDIWDGVELDAMLEVKISLDMILDKAKELKNTLYRCGYRGNV